MRNENSVLFSLDNLTSHIQRQDNSQRSEKSSEFEENSALIDIQTLSQSVPEDTSHGRDSDLFASLSPSDTPSPVMQPLSVVATRRTPSRLFGATLAMGVLVLVAIAGLGVTLAAIEPDTESRHLSQLEAQPDISPETIEQPFSNDETSEIEENRFSETQQTPEIGSNPQEAANPRETIRQETNNEQAPQQVSKRPRPIHRQTTTAHESNQQVNQQRPGDSPQSIAQLIKRAVGPESENTSPLVRHQPTTTQTSATAESDGRPRSLTRAQVRAGMNRVASAVRRCGNGQSGRVFINVVISGDTGRIRSARVEGEYAGTPSGSCAARAVRRAEFPRFSRSTLSVRYPFSF